MRNCLRKSGIDIVGDVPWGTHICQFFHTKEDLTDILVPFFKEGLENNEFCLWITSQPLEVEDAIEALRKVVSDLDIYLKKGQIEIISYNNWFFTGNTFDMQKVSSGCAGKLSYAEHKGYEGVRLCGNNSWLDEKNWDSFIKFKEQMDNVIDNYRMIALCTYSLDRHNVDEIMYLGINHQFTLVKSKGKWKLVESYKRKMAEEAAAKATKDWEHTFDAVPDLIAIIDTNYRIVRANRAMATKLGMTPEECTGLTCYRIVHGTTKPPSFCPHSQLLKDEFEHTAEVCEDCLGGYFIVSVSPIYDSTGKLTGSIHVARDINERRRIEDALRESETHFRALAKNSPDIITRFDRHNRYLYANPAIVEPFGYFPEEVIGKTHKELGMDSEKIRFWEKHHEMVFITGKPETMEFSYISPQGKEYYFNTKIVPEFVDGKVISVLALSRDITGIKEAETKLKETLDNLEKLVEERTEELQKAYNLLKESEKGLAEAQRMAHIGNLDINLLTGEVYLSDELYRILRCYPQESGLNYDKFLSCVHPDSQENVDNAIKKAMDGKPIEGDYTIVLANGEERKVHKHIEIISNENKIPVRIKGIVQDITELKKSEEKVRNLANIVESSTDAIGTISLEGTISSWNKGAKEVYGFSAEDILERPVSFLSPSHLGDEIKKLCERIKQGESINNYETVQLRKDGKTIYVSITLSPVTDLYGKLTAISFISRDITKIIETKKALADIEISRKKEIHHRIKNNLQVISSLLDLQADKFRDRKNIKDSEVLEAFRESQDRVISMALIHEELYRGGGLEKLNFSLYIGELAENLFQTCNFRNTAISLTLNLEENIFFDMDIAVPLGMIINELVSNSFKHAFHGRDTGEIRIKLHRKDNRESINSINQDFKSTTFTLTVSDNGIGIPEHLNIKKLNSLGLQLVTSLVDQLDGELEIKRKNGTEFNVRFIVKEKNNLAVKLSQQITNVIKS